MAKDWSYRGGVSIEQRANAVRQPKASPLRGVTQGTIQLGSLARVQQGRFRSRAIGFSGP